MFPKIALARVGWLVGIAVCGVILLPSNADAEEAHCMNCWNVDGFGGTAGLEDGHTFSFSQIGEFGGFKDCHSWNACHTGDPQPGDCVDWHDPCGSGPHALRQVQEAIEAGHLGELYALARQPNSLVTISEKSGYVLVSDCDRRSLIGAVRLPASSITEALVRT